MYFDLHLALYLCSSLHCYEEQCSFDNLPYNVLVKKLHVSSVRIVVSIVNQKTWKPKLAIDFYNVISLLASYSKLLDKIFGKTKLFGKYWIRQFPTDTSQGKRLKHHNLLKVEYSYDIETKLNRKIKHSQ